jgi:hypothetical protein
MKHLATIILFCSLYSCNTPAQNYYPDKVNDTAFYVGNTNYRDYFGHDINYKDTVYVIRIGKDSIAITAPNFFIFEHAEVEKMNACYTFRISNNKQYPYKDSTVSKDDSVVIVRNHSLYDFSVNSKLNVRNTDIYRKIGMVQRFKEYEFTGKRRFFH